MLRAAEGAGRSLGTAIVGALVLVYAIALTLNLTTSVELDDAALSLAGIVAILVLLLFGQLGAGRRHAHDEKVAEELDVLSQRLLRVEANLAALDGSGVKAKSTLRDMSSDVHSLSEIVKNLAEALTVQDREIAALKRGERSLSFKASGGTAQEEQAGAAGAFVVPSFLPAPEPAPAPLRRPAPDNPSLSGASDEARAVLEAVRAGQVDLHVQAVVNLPQRRDRIYEAYPLLRPAGREPLVPSQYLAIVGRAGMLPDFEAALVAMSLVFAHRLATAGSDARVSVPLSDEAIADRSFLRRLDALVEDHGPVARRVVLEISQRACDGAGPGFEVLARLRERGVAFGLTKVKDLNLNPPALARLGVRFVKIRSDRLVAAIEAGPSGSDLVTLIDALSRSTIDVIADAVEDEVIVPELLDAGVPLAQGLALALPCPAEAVLERSPRRPSTELQAGAPIAPRRPEDPGPSGPQGSLRDFLRRAG